MLTKFIIIAVGGLLTAWLLVHGKGTRWILLCVATFSIMIGDHTLHLGYWSAVVPLEVILWLLCIVVVPSSALCVPPSLLLLFAWGVVRALVTVVLGADWDSVLAWTLPLADGFAALVVIGALVDNVARLKTVLRIVLLASLVMSVCSVVEYLFPRVSQLIPWWFSGNKEIVTSDGFVRAPFSFFGYSTAASMVAWGTIIAYDSVFNSKSRAERWAAGLAVSVNLYAIYISGQRSAWVGLAAALVVMSLYIGMRAILAYILLAALTVALAAAAFWARVDTITTFLATGTTVEGDTSAGEHLVRWTTSWRSMLDSPLVGVGYANPLAHNAFLEIGRTIGLIPAVLFLVFLCCLWFRIASLAKQAPTADGRRYGFLFCALMIIVTIELSAETVLPTPAFAAAYWLLISLVWLAPTLFGESRVRVFRDRLAVPPAFVTNPGNELTCPHNIAAEIL